MNAPRLWLVRHARPLVAAGVCYGRLDLAADAGATRAAAAALARALPARVAALRHSTLQRCELFAHTLQGFRPDLAPEPDAGLCELDFGSWEGLAWEAIGREAVDAWSADLARHAPGGGEPLAAMLARVGRALARDTALARALRADMVWVSHAGVARCVQWLLTHGCQRLPSARQWPREAPDYGRWRCFTLTG